MGNRSDELVVLDGSTFFISDRAGDAHGAETEGLFFSDVRHLSRWELLIDGEPVRVLTSRNIDYYSARIYATLPSARVGNNPSLSVRRDRIVADGMHEDITVENHSGARRRVVIELRYDADFADLFEVKEAAAPKGELDAMVREREVALTVTRDGQRRGTRLVFGADGHLGRDRATFDVTLGPRQRFATCIDAFCSVGATESGPRAGHGGFGRLQPQMPLTLEQWLADAPELEADDDVISHTYRQSLLDLAALRFRPLPELGWSLPAAGLPWFMALFGRDSLLTAYMALPFQPHLAKTTLRALAALQASEDDPYRDAEPGKILHELRRGVLAASGKAPHSPYYGSHDATALFLILLDEYERWTADTRLVKELEPAARGALAWIEGPGDRDGDGYLEYQTRSSAGLENQCWKDSRNSILFTDGQQAVGPIATCEIQGYAYDARLRTARLARDIWRDTALAQRLEADAAALRARFDSDYWIEARGHYALALDSKKRQVDSLTSNVGHLLWSGIVPDHRVEQVVAQLRGAQLASGWGIRTMSTADAGYNPIEYHNGTVWPHDTAIIAEGLRRYGYRDEAATLVLALFDAAGAFGYRLPEVFAGFARAETAIPVEYPTASSPQAWAAAAPLLGLRTQLGLDPTPGGLRSEPHLPSPLGRLRLRAVACRGDRYDAP